MFEKLLDPGYVRTGRQALGFYIVSLAVFIVFYLLTGGKYDLVFRLLILIFALFILKGKQNFGSGVAWLWTLCAVLFSPFFGLIFLAILSTVPPNTFGKGYEASSLPKENNDNYRINWKKMFIIVPILVLPLIPIILSINLIVLLFTSPTGLTYGTLLLFTFGIVDIIFLVFFVKLSSRFLKSLLSAPSFIGYSLLLCFGVFSLWAILTYYLIPGF